MQRTGTTSAAGASGVDHASHHLKTLWDLMGVHVLLPDDVKLDAAEQRQNVLTIKLRTPCSVTHSVDDVCVSFVLIDTPPIDAPNSTVVADIRIDKPIDNFDALRAQYLLSGDVSRFLIDLRQQLNQT